MGLALALSRRSLGRTWPNPSVGAVVVGLREGRLAILGCGVTQPGGRPHGEAMAYEAAGAGAAGGTLYVALEPCAYSSVRGGIPCVERTLNAGIRRVVSAIEDPNPRIAGLGHALLRTAGLKVEVGLMREEAARIHRGHFRRARGAAGRDLQGRAYGGRLCRRGRADAAADLVPDANRWVHLMRARHDAIMIGVDTALADDPQLTVRLPGMETRSPVRVVLDSRLRLPPTYKLVRTARDVPTWVIAAETAPVEPERALTAAGVEVMRVGAGADGRLLLREALGLLAERGITRIFSEGGPTVGERLALEGLADEVIVSTSPRALGHPGVVAVRPALAALLAEGGTFRIARDRLIGEDRFTFYERVS